MEKLLADGQDRNIGMPDEFNTPHKLGRWTNRSCFEDLMESIRTNECKDKKHDVVVILAQAI